MLTFQVYFGLAGLLGLGSFPAAERQSYAKFWQKQGGYYYRQYQYKPEEDSTSVFYHLAVYYPSRPGHIYFYNPYRDRYWGRYDAVAGGYSRLADKDQREKLADIQETAFPKPGPMPVIPEATDGVKMLPPPGVPPDEADQVSVEKMKQLVAAAGLKEPPRQVYSDWCKQGGYFYRCYFYQPVVGGAFRSHRVIYYPSKPRFVFFYNPHKGKYWGRYDFEAKGYSLLGEKDRSDRLSSIPETAFPRPGEMPPVPEATDDVKVLAPPHVLPE